MRQYRAIPPRAIEPSRILGWYPDEYWDSGPKTMDVIETDHTTHDTGLLDLRGNRIVAISVMEPIGFGRAQ